MALENVKHSLKAGIRFKENFLSGKNFALCGGNGLEELFGGALDADDVKLTKGVNLYRREVRADHKRSGSILGFFIFLASCFDGLPEKRFLKFGPDKNGNMRRIVTDELIVPGIRLAASLCVLSERKRNTKRSLI
jgi:hypothetical protein